MRSLIHRDLIDAVWAFSDDVAQAAQAQDRKTDKVELPAFPVTLPEGVIPRFFDTLEVARTRKSDSRTAGRSIVRNFGWARHEFPIGLRDPAVAGLGKVLYTRGLFIGGRPAEIDDYNQGLLTLMTADRFSGLSESLRCNPPRGGYRKTF